MNINKIEDLVSLSKLGDLIHKGELEQKKEEEKKCCNAVVIALAVVGAVAAIAAIAYAVYRYFTPDYLDDYEDDLRMKTSEMKTLKMKRFRLLRSNSD